MTNPDDLLPEGLADALPAEAAAVSRAMRAVLDAMDAQGYDRVRPPLVEFEQALAQRMDGISPRRMIRFTDPVSLRTLAVRSDMTVQVGRIAPHRARRCAPAVAAVLRRARSPRSPRIRSIRRAQGPPNRRGIDGCDALRRPREGGGR